MRAGLALLALHSLCLLSAPVAASPIEHNGFLSVQIDVDANGRNVIGDAANEPTLAVDPNDPNRIVVGWRHFYDATEDLRQDGVALSTDGGRHWRFQGTLEPGSLHTDPVLAVDASGRFYYLTLSLTLTACDLFTSVDGGESWVGPIRTFGGDKPWMASDAFGHLYVDWTPYEACCENRSFTRSLDGGTSFMEPIELGYRTDWGTVAVGRPGSVYVAGENMDDPDRFVVARSLDAADPEAVPTFDCFEGDLGGRLVAFKALNRGGLLGQIWLAVDRSGAVRDGTLYVLASVDPAGTDPLDVHFARSEDDGETWSAPIRVNDDDGETWEWFGTLSVAPTGRLDSVWIHNTDPTHPEMSELRYSSSGDAGKSWSPSVAITPRFDSRAGPVENKLGDYIQLSSDRTGAHLVYAATFHGEQDVYYVRIGQYDCNGNGLGDADEIAAGFVCDRDGDGIPDECERGRMVPENALRPCPHGQPLR